MIPRGCGSIRHNIALALLAVCTLMTSVTTRAESPPPECLADENCADGYCDWTGSCWPAEEACNSSADCGESAACGQFEHNCPLEGEGEACPEGVRGRCYLFSDRACAADAECGTDELCWAMPRLPCAEGDDACSRALPGSCTGWARFCGPDSSVSCSAQESCIERRCIWHGAEDEFVEIEGDTEKADRLEVEWQQGPPAPKTGTTTTTTDTGASETSAPVADAPMACNEAFDAYNLCLGAHEANCKRCLIGSVMEEMPPDSCSEREMFLCEIEECCEDCSNEADLIVDSCRMILVNGPAGPEGEECIVNCKALEMTTRTTAPPMDTQSRSGRRAAGMSATATVIGGLMLAAI